MEKWRQVQNIWHFFLSKFFYLFEIILLFGIKFTFNRIFPIFISFLSCFLHVKERILIFRSFFFAFVLIFSDKTFLLFFSLIIIISKFVLWILVQNPVAIYYFYDLETKTKTFNKIFAIVHWIFWSFIWFILFSSRWTLLLKLNLFVLFYCYYLEQKTTFSLIRLWIFGKIFPSVFTNYFFLPGFVYNGTGHLNAYRCFLALNPCLSNVTTSDSWIQSKFLPIYIYCLEMNGILFFFFWKANTSFVHRG